jgi:hypothetical protein
VKGQLRIDAMFAFIMRDADGTEGVCAFMNPDTRIWTPLVGADLARVESLRPLALELALAHGRPITLAYFSERRDVELLEPTAAPEAARPRS